MLKLRNIISCVYFALLVVAPLPPPASPGTDACGPFDHQGDAGFNTCFSSVVPGGPAPYGIVCGIESAVTTNLTKDVCAEAAQEMCLWFAQGKLEPGEWHWTADGVTNLCRVGIFPATGPAIAPIPNYRRCLNQIMQPMVLSCIDTKYNVATVNIKSLPDVATSFTGEAVNPGYPAYIVSPMALYYSSNPPATPNVWGSPTSSLWKD